jgi:hypothetical protein
MRMLALIAAILLFLSGCLATSATIVFTERTFNEDNELVRKISQFNIALPEGVPDFTKHGEPAWKFEEDYLRMVSYPLEPGGILNLYTGGWYFVVWVEHDVFRPLYLERASIEHLYWIYDKAGVPSPATRADIIALIDHYRKIEQEKQSGETL